MIISNEPGYYAAGKFGIRIENLIVVEERKIAGAEAPMLGFETITLAPIDLSLVEPKLLDADEIAWLNAYHARVRKTLSPRVEPRPAHGLKRRRGAWRRLRGGAMAQRGHLRAISSIRARIAATANAGGRSEGRSTIGSRSCDGIRPALEGRASTP